MYLRTRTSSIIRGLHYGCALRWEQYVLPTFPGYPLQSLCADLHYDTLFSNMPHVLPFTLAACIPWVLAGARYRGHARGFDHPKVTTGGLPIAARGKDPGLQTASNVHRFSLA